MCVEYLCVYLYTHAYAYREPDMLVGKYNVIPSEATQSDLS